MVQSIHYDIAFKVVFIQFVWCRNNVTITSVLDMCFSIMISSFLTVQEQGCIATVNIFLVFYWYTSTSTNVMWHTQHSVNVFTAWILPFLCLFFILVLFLLFFFLFLLFLLLFLLLVLLLFLLLALLLLSLSSFSSSSSSTYSSSSSSSSSSFSSSSLSSA